MHDVGLQSATAASTSRSTADTSGGAHKSHSETALGRHAHTSSFAVVVPPPLPPSPTALSAVNDAADDADDDALMMRRRIASGGDTPPTRGQRASTATVASPTSRVVDEQHTTPPPPHSSASQHQLLSPPTTAATTSAVRSSSTDSRSKYDKNRRRSESKTGTIRLAISSFLSRQRDSNRLKAMVRLAYTPRFCRRAQRNLEDADARARRKQRRWRRWRMASGGGFNTKSAASSTPRNARRKSK